MKYVMIVFSLLLCSCEHIAITHKCNGDKICRCKDCENTTCKDCLCDEYKEIRSRK